MKNVFIFFVLILFTSNLYSQIDFKDEPESFNDKYQGYYDYKKINKTFNKEFNLKNDYDFEMRLWIDPSPMQSRHLFLMKKTGDKWDAACYHLRYNSKKEILINQDNLTKLWTDLMRNNVLTLPDQEILREKMRVYTADTLAAQGIYYNLSNTPYENPFILDGVFYRIELRTKDAKRAYTYHCPKGYIKECPNVEELFHAYAIVYLIFRKIGWNPEDIC